MSNNIIRKWPNLGRVVATAGVAEWFKDQSVKAGFLSSCLNRHLNADWGELGEEDKAANDAALIDGSRILSAYDFSGRRVWIITEAEGQDGDRAYTTILFPDEY